MNAKESMPDRENEDQETSSSQEPENPESSAEYPSPDVSGEFPGSQQGVSDGDEGLLRIPAFILQSIHVDEDGRATTLVPADVEPLPAENRPEVAPAPGNTEEPDQVPESAEESGGAPPPLDEQAESPATSPEAEKPPTPAPSTEEGPPSAQESAPEEEPSESTPSFSVEQGTSVFQFAAEVAAACFSRLGDWDSARDATAETITNCLRVEHWQPGLTDEGQRRHILTLSSQVSLDLLRRSALLTTGPPSVTPRSVSAGKGVPAKETGDSGTVAGLDSASPEERSRLLVTELPEPQRSIVRMRMWNGLTFAGIARSLNKTEHSIASLYRAVLKALEKRIQELDPPLDSPPPTEGPSIDSGVPLPADGTSLGPEAAELERTLHALLPAPQARPDSSILVAVARRVLAGTASVEGTLRFASGPLDLLSATQRLRNLARLKGDPHIERHPGEQVFAGEILVTAPDTSALIALRTGHELLIGPGSIVVIGSGTPTEDASSAASLLQGRAVCIPGAQVSSTFVVSFPGGTAQSFYDAFQISVLSLASTRVDVVEGTPVVTNPSVKQNPGRGQSLMCRGGTNPAIGPARKEPTPLGWFGPVLGLAGFPEDTRDRLEAVTSAVAAPPTRATTPAARRASSASTPSRVRNRRRLLAAAGLFVLAAVIAAFALSRGRSTHNAAAADWFAELSRSRRVELGLPSRGPSEPPPVITLASGHGGPFTFSPALMPFYPNPQDFTPQYLTYDDYRRNRLLALTQLRAAGGWPDTPEELVNSFCERLKAQSAEDLDLIVPGTSRSFWGAILPMTAPPTDSTIQPNEGILVDPSLSVFQVILECVGQKYGYELVVLQNGETGNRPCIDFLASRWDLPVPRIPGPALAPAGSPPGTQAQ